MAKSDEILEKMNEWQKELDALGMVAWKTVDGELDWDKYYRVSTKMKSWVKSWVTGGAPQHARRTPPRPPFKRRED